MSLWTSLRRGERGRVARSGRVATSVARRRPGLEQSWAAGFECPLRDWAARSGWHKLSAQRIRNDKDMRVDMRLAQGSTGRELRFARVAMNDV